MPQSAILTTEWTHFADIVNIVGRDPDGYARSYWDNVGVQYGLEAVASGQITPDEFLKLNAVIGGWKNEPDMVQEGQPFYPAWFLGIHGVSATRSTVQIHLALPHAL